MLMHLAATCLPTYKPSLFSAHTNKRVALFLLDQGALVWLEQTVQSLEPRNSKRHTSQKAQDCCSACLRVYLITEMLHSIGTLLSIPPDSILPLSFCFCTARYLLLFMDAPKEPLTIFCAATALQKLLD